MGRKRCIAGRVRWTRSNGGGIQNGGAQRGSTVLVGEIPPVEVGTH